MSGKSFPKGENVQEEWEGEKGLVCKLSRLPILNKFFHDQTKP